MKVTKKKKIAAIVSFIICSIVMITSFVSKAASSTDSETSAQDVEIKTIKFEEETKSKAVVTTYDTLTVAVPQVEEPEKDITQKYIYLGDSRTVGTQRAVQEVSNDVYFVAEVGQGYVWLKKQGINQVNDILKSDTESHWTIITNLGINDLGNVEKYISLYQDLLKTDWKDIDLVFETVNPVDETKCSNITNNMIVDFNSKVADILPVIDTYHYIQSSFASSDGLHYDSSTYQKIYRYIKIHLQTGLTPGLFYF